MVELGISLNCPPIKNYANAAPQSRKNKSKKYKKSVDCIPSQCYLSPAMIEEIEFVSYCHEAVELLDIENTPYGNLARIRFDDGREDQVPLNTIDFLD